MLSIICGVRFGEADDFSATKTYSNLLDNNHVANICEHALFKTFIADLIALEDDKDKAVEAAKAHLNQYITNACGDDTQLMNDLIGLAISCLQAFAIVNWLGPTPVELANIPSMLKNESDKEITLNDRVFCLKEHFQDDVKVDFVVTLTAHRHKYV